MNEILPVNSVSFDDDLVLSPSPKGLYREKNSLSNEFSPSSEFNLIEDDIPPFSPEKNKGNINSFQSKDKVELHSKQDCNNEQAKNIDEDKDEDEDVLFRKFKAFQQSHFNPDDAMENLYNIIESTRITSINNNKILYQLFASLEERMNQKFEEFKAEVYQHLQQQQEFYLNNHTVKKKLPGEQSKVPSQPTQNIPPLYPLNQGASAAAASALDYEMMTITPYPGFVIKTKRLLNQNFMTEDNTLLFNSLNANHDKIFINVFYHDLIELEPESYLISSSIVNNKPYFITGESFYVLDKHGTNCLTYNICVNDQYFRNTNQNNIVNFSITSPESIRKIIHKINLNFNDFLDENSYSLPRLNNGYKGETIPQISIPINKKNRRKFFQESMLTVEDEVNPNLGGNYNRDSEYSMRSNHRNSINSLDDCSVISELTADNLLSFESTTSHPTSSSYPVSPNNKSYSANSSFNNLNAFVSNKSTPRNSFYEKKKGDNISDTNSVSSQSSINSKKNNKKKLKKKSITSSTLSSNINTNLLSYSMLEYNEKLNLSKNAQANLIEESINNPSVLLGYQIIVMRNDQRIVVVLDIRKNFFNQTEFLICNLTNDSEWVRLRRDRSKTGNGIDFYPQRKVLYGLDEDDTIA